MHTEEGLVPVGHDMTILELMTHTGGLTYGVFGNTPVDQEYRRAEILSRGLSLEEMTKRLGAIPLEFQPGSRWLYSVSVDVQGRLVEVLSGMEFEAFLRERVWGRWTCGIPVFMFRRGRRIAWLPVIRRGCWGGWSFRMIPRRVIF